MKTLFLVRHAKSDWDNASLKDIERPLNERGYANANSMSSVITEKPDLIISSPAIRAMSTALIFARHLNYSPNTIIIKEELYESSIDHYLEVIKNCTASAERVMLFAHNPTISDVADTFCKEFPHELPTCGIAGIRFNATSWKDIKPKSGELILFDYPKKSG